MALAETGIEIYFRYLGCFPIMILHYFFCSILNTHYSHLIKNTHYSILTSNTHYSILKSKIA
jgi:hypothetical protein